MNSLAYRVETARLGQMHMFSLGQAGYIIRSKSGQLLGIDMYLSECVERVEGHLGFKRLLPKILDPFDLEFDVVIATHPHFDHFDMDAIPQLMSNPKTKLFASVDCEKEAKRLAMSNRNCTYVKPDDNVQVGDFHIEFVHCDHGAGAPDAVGVVITVDGKKIYEVGDTCLRLDWADALRDKGSFDVMIAPINGTYGNLNEEECVTLSQALQPKLTIPCHYGMFASHGGNLGMFYRYATEKKINCLLMSMGEKYTL
ncbi:MAG: MBL fold metallo-hydrolase [Clostridia bacterium]